MIRCSCHGLQGCVPVAPSATPSAVGELAELGTALGHARGRVGEGLAAARPDLDLGRDQLADEMRLELGALRGRLQLLEAVRRATSVSGSRIANSSSTATVKSVADSNCSRREPQLFVARLRTSLARPSAERLL